MATLLMRVKRGHVLSMSPMELPDEKIGTPIERRKTDIDAIYRLEQKGWKIKTILPLGGGTPPYDWDKEVWMTTD